ncbi:MAG: hypothetical protein M3310_01220 [Actinomycetota bacterium]|nr:hypothetical protein [Actinomycetota bacterium]
MARTGTSNRRVPAPGAGPSYRALLAGYLVMNAVATAIDALIWGWRGLVATGLGGLLLLAVFVVIARRRRSRAR